MATLEEIRSKKRRGKELTDEENERLDLFWRSGSGSNSKGGSSYMPDAPDSPFASFVSEVRAIREARKLEAKPGVLYCSFCGRAVTVFEATLGKASRIYVREDLVSSPETAPDMEIEQTIIAKNEKVVACPEHSLMIKPRTDKKGNYVGHSIDFDAYCLE